MSDKESDLWATPIEVFDVLNDRYGPFDFDAAANASNRKVDLWLGPGSTWDTDALVASWRPTQRLAKAWLNPPYSDPTPFVAKAWQEAHAGNCMVTMLLPSTTEVKWWKDYVYDNTARRFYRGVEVEFWPTRIRHISPDGSRGGSPKFGSVVVTFYGGL